METGLSSRLRERLSVLHLPVFSVRCERGQPDVDDLEEFEKLPDDGNLHELDEGELIVMPPQGFTHGKVQMAVLSALSQAAERSGTSIVPGRCGFHLAPDVVLAPDVAVVSRARQAEMLPDRYCEFGPDLVVEVLSPDDTAARLQRKIGRYLAAGTSARVASRVFDPGAGTV